MPIHGMTRRMYQSDGYCSAQHVRRRCLSCGSGGMEMEVSHDGGSSACSRQISFHGCAGGAIQAKNCEHAQ